MPAGQQPTQPNLPPGTSPDQMNQSTKMLFGTLLQGQNPYANLPGMLTLAKKLKKEAFAYQPIYERSWQRILYYILGRQWMTWHPRRGQWIDRRMYRWVPRPVTNKTSETLVAIRSMFSAVQLGVNVRPNGRDSRNVIAASVSDEILPLIHTEHRMNRTYIESDFWFIALGNAFLHPWYDISAQNGIEYVNMEQCLNCGAVSDPSAIEENQGTCPSCNQSQSFVPAMDPTTGMPIDPIAVPKGRGRTDAVSPFEIGCPQNFLDFDDLPYLFRKRWRDRSYYEERLPADVVKKMNFSKTPTDRSLQLFMDLSRQTDLGVGSSIPFIGSTGNEPESEGIEEYELWMKPNSVFPEGLVLRMADDQIVELPDEGMPGPLPHRDIANMPLWPWIHMQFEHFGGRLFGTSVLDKILGAQDSLNRLDSIIELAAHRMANPVWLEPKGTEVQKFTGEPGLVIKYNMLASGQGKPERLDGANVPSSLFQLREQKLRDIEELAGTFDIIKGQKPTGVEAFSALQLLVERSQSRFSTAFSQRGESYRRWSELALELERQYGPDERTKATMSQNKTWAFETFKRAQLQGSITIVVEDGSNTPKTALGRRAAIEQANNLQAINIADPDVQYQVLSEFGLSHLVPGLDAQVSAALQEQEQFEQWASSPEGQQAAMMQQQQQQAGLPPPVDPATGMPVPPPSPVRVHVWDNHAVHLQEHAKWASSDRVRESMMQNPALEGAVTQHYVEHQQMVMALMAPAPGQEGGQGAGGGQAFGNSNRESTQGNEPRGTGEGAQRQGPA